jgi:peroxiredoxin
VERLHRDLSRKGLAVIAVNIEESRSTVDAWVKEKHVTIPILLDTDGAVTRQYGVIATPTAFLIDRQGRLLGRVVAARLGLAGWDGADRGLAHRRTRPLIG